jgi:hypothetical protein
VRRKLKRFRALIFALPILMSFYLTYTLGNGWGEIYSLSSHLTLEKFEVADEEDLVIDSPAPSEEIILASFLNLGYPSIPSFQETFCPSFQSVFFQQKLTILRC